MKTITYQQKLKAFEDWRELDTTDTRNAFKERDYFEQWIKLVPNSEERKKFIHRWVNGLKGKRWYMVFDTWTTSIEAFVQAENSSEALLKAGITSEYNPSPPCCDYGWELVDALECEEIEVQESLIVDN